MNSNSFWHTLHERAESLFALLRGCSGLFALSDVGDEDGEFKFISNLVRRKHQLNRKLGSVLSRRNQFEFAIQDLFITDRKSVV